MAEYLIQDATLTGIADAIREKTGLDGTIFPGEMPDHIRGISTSDEEIPADITAEALRVAVGMREKIAANGVTFLAMADMHQPGDGDIGDETVAERYRRGNRNAAQGAKLVAEQVELDFVANLGDLAFGSTATTVPDGTKAILSVRMDTGDVESEVLSFRTPGNHDTLTYSYTQNGEYLTPDVIAGLIGTYGYHDLEEKKVRIICLNTADNSGASVESDGGTERISGEQLQWFAEALDLSGKSDGALWQIILLAHHPLDWGAIRPAGNCLAAYLAGEAYSATHNGVAVSYDFSGKNVAGIIAQFHGHTHCFKVDHIHDFRSGSPVATLAKRVAIPNACFYRNNEYGTTETYGLIFGEETTYSKTDDATGKNTAFCLVSVDLDQQIIYADCFGAGYDRIIGYSEMDLQMYDVTNQLTGAQSSNSATYVIAGTAYSAVITAKDGYELESVTVAMGGQDVTDAVCSNGSIHIPEVTGPLVITAVAKSTQVYEVTNLVLQAQAQDSTDLYNGTGYMDGVYVSSSGGVSEDAVCVSTGFIPYTWAPDQILYIRGAEVSATSHVRFYGYETKTDLYPNSSAYCSGLTLETYFTVETLEDNYYKLTPLNTVDAVKYLRISLIGTGADLIVTCNEPIGSEEEDGDSGSDTGSSGYTNLVSSSVDTDGSVYNGTGYQLDYRLNSSGAETPSDGSIVSGFISNTGETLRIWGASDSTVGLTGNYISLCGSDFAPILVVSYGTLVECGAVWEEVEGKYMLTVDPATLTSETYQAAFLDGKYLRCSLSMVADAGDFVVTLGEEIPRE